MECTSARRRRQTMSGLACLHTRPGAHTGDGGDTNPSHGPPTPETQPHALAIAGRLSQVAPVGQVPPHVPAASAPQGSAHDAAGPGQQAGAPVGVRHRQACSHPPSTHRSAVQPFPSSHSASVTHAGGGHCGSQTSFGFRHGTPGPHGSKLHCRSTVTKHRPLGGGGGQVATQNCSGRHGWSGPHGCVVHLRVTVSKHVPIGGGDPHAGEQNSFGNGHPSAGEQATPLHSRTIVSKQPPAAVHGPTWSLHAPACCRRQSLP